MVSFIRLFVRRRLFILRGRVFYIIGGRFSVSYVRSVRLENLRRYVVSTGITTVS